MKQKIEGDYVHVDSVGWQPFSRRIFDWGHSVEAVARLARDGGLDGDF